jgi:hypothetical protein
METQAESVVTFAQNLAPHLAKLLGDAGLPKENLQRKEKKTQESFFSSHITCNGIEKNIFLDKSSKSHGQTITRPKSVTDPNNNAWQHQVSSYLKKI